MVQALTGDLRDNVLYMIRDGVSAKDISIANRISLRQAQRMRLNYIRWGSIVVPRCGPLGRPRLISRPIEEVNRSRRTSSYLLMIFIELTRFSQPSSHRIPRRDGIPHMGSIRY